MLKSCCALLFLLFPCAAAAQYPGDEYYPYAEREERRELLTTDSAIFYRAVHTNTAWRKACSCCLRRLMSSTTEMK